MLKECLQFFIEPAKNLKTVLKETLRKASRREKRDDRVLEECQLFIMELARELNRVCENSDILIGVWMSKDTWSPEECRCFIVEWAAQLESKQRLQQTHGWPEKVDISGLAVEKLREGDERGVEDGQRIIAEWARGLKSMSQRCMWPGESVALVLEELEMQWKRGRLPNLIPAMEFIMWTLLVEDMDKGIVPQLWLSTKQRSRKSDAANYIPNTVWKWIRSASDDVTLDPDTANPDLILSEDEKRVRCGYERQDLPNYPKRFDGWWCALGREGFTSGRHYWEVEVGGLRDWRLGVTRESAQRKGYKSLNTESGFWTLRLERGSELKALAVPYMPLPMSLIPQKVGVYLDFEEGQLSFYNVERRSHIYTFTDTFNEKLYPLFGTVDITKDLVIKSSFNFAEHYYCTGQCLWC
ncbi:butyrophilin subfamily 1 member A1-like [Polyodon spathula]|uniref:butyrophilin subfamily 1 member A1-like n=1 Tax=Polyodon spathula TaxID=7913 RepID=UPI001B7DA291|nr:butyrophilin subfamily 1 member A1-like [Polyodon spathula]XP_041075907.1 butyrophilin subfamily 1 member A1-like [Polyodon spathula]